MTDISICILPRIYSTGGPATFQAKLKLGLKKLGIETHHEISRIGTRALLITGATRNLGAILEARRRGIRIVQRLDGMNWLHKRHPTGIKHYLRSELMNAQLASIRRFFADEIVYQSSFTQAWWNRTYGSLDKPDSVIHNGVDLNIFTPHGKEKPPHDTIRIVVVEGSFKGGHKRDLLNAVEFAEKLSQTINKQVNLLIAGFVPQDLKGLVTPSNLFSVSWMGIVAHERIPEIHRGAHLFFPSEINAACPNSVVEALACGLPVVGYATGSIAELVGTNGGIVVPYGSDHWKLNPPNCEPLIEAAMKILHLMPHYRKSARDQAEVFLGLDQMVDKYQKILLKE